MNEVGARPGGLTALAVLNFIGAGLDLLQGIYFGVCALALRKYPPGTPVPGDYALREIVVTSHKNGMTAEVFFLQAASDLPLSVLLLVSGIGYLKQKQFLGRTLGSVYAVCSLVALAAIVPRIPREHVSIGILIGLLYPLVTLYMVNGSFREDLRR
jgi:hypothetical protein